MTTTAIGVQGGDWSYAKSSKTESRSEKAGKASEAAPEAKPRTSDAFVPSGKVPSEAGNGAKSLDELLETEADKAEGAKKGTLDLSSVQQEMKKRLIEQMRQAIEALRDLGNGKKPAAAKPLDNVELVSDILYAVAPEEKAAEVPEEWNADNTSQRIVDFALSFRGQIEGMSDEEFVENIRSAIKDGFRSAKGDMKEIPGPAAKLFNDTYEAAMKKLDDKLAEWKKASGSGEEDVQASVAAATAANASGQAAKGVSPPASTFSVVA